MIIQANLTLSYCPKYQSCLLQRLTIFYTAFQCLRGDTLYIAVPLIEIMLLKYDKILTMNVSHSVRCTTICSRPSCDILYVKHMKVCLVFLMAGNL